MKYSSIYSFVLKLAAMLLLALASVAPQPLSAAPDENLAHNPVIWADVPDIAMIRVGKTYYMSSTTMHLSPGLPIMESTDLVNWRMASPSAPLALAVPLPPAST